MASAGMRYLQSILLVCPLLVALQASVAFAQCATIPGYTLASDTDHYGDDIRCDKVSSSTAARRCSGSNVCKAFNTYSVNGVAWACTKKVSGPTSAAKDICFYTKASSPPGCPQVAGYTLASNVDHYGDDIQCDKIASSTAASRCSGSNDCKAFNTYAVNGVAWACTKKVSGPTSAAKDICFYTKAAPGCPEVAGYKLAGNSDHYGDDINCAPVGLASASKSCSGDAACKAFNTYTVAGADWACTKRVAGPTAAAPGICFYTKDGPGPNPGPTPTTCKPSSGSDRVLIAQNRCSYPVWLAALANAGKSPYGSETTFQLAPGACTKLPLPVGWAGRFWGKVGCNPTGSGCTSGSAPPFTLAEVTMSGWGGLDYYDISLVDGYNVGMTFGPIDTAGNLVPGSSGYKCANVGCRSNLLDTCPPELQVRGGPNNQVVACATACTRFGTNAYCCTGPNQCGPQCCPPTDYSRIFKAACPLAYSYAYDDQTSTFTCTPAAASGGYLLNFCLG